MSTAIKKINSLSTLEKEIRRLKADAKRMEAQMDDNFSYLQENYVSLALNSILPEKTTYKGIPATIISLFLEHDRFRNTVIKLAEQLVNKVSDGIDFISEKLSGKKD
jgi:cell shape-determining protein MreC